MNPKKAAKLYMEKDEIEELKQQLLAASLENKQLKEAINNALTRSFMVDVKYILHDVLSFTNYSATAGLYLELRDKTLEALERLELYTDRGDYDDSILIKELRDILKRIKEQG